LTHQAVAMSVLTLAIFQAERLAVRQAPQQRHKHILPVAQVG